MPRTFSSNESGVDLDAGGLEHLLGIGADRHLRGRGDDDQVGVGEILDAADPLRVARLHDDGERVRGERGRIPVVESGVDQLVHVVLVSGREDVGRRAVLDDRGRQLGGGREVEHDVGIGVRRLELDGNRLEGVRERRRGEHVDVARQRVRSGGYPAARWSRSLQRCG